MGRRHLLPGAESGRRARGSAAVDGDRFQSSAAVRVRRGPNRRAGARRRGAGRGQRAVGGGRAAVLRRRGGAVHQRHDRGARRLLRACRRGGRVGRAAARRPAARRWLELLDLDRFDGVVVRQHARRARGAAGLRAGHRRLGRDHRGPTGGGGVPAGPQPVPPPEHRRTRFQRLPRVVVPAALALRRSAGAGLLPTGRPARPAA